MLQPVLYEDKKIKVEEGIDGSHTIYIKIPFDSTPEILSYYRSVVEEPIDSWSIIGCCTVD